MKTIEKELTQEQSATKMVKAWLEMGWWTKFDLAEDLGISRPTLDSRIEKCNWKKSELVLLRELSS